MTIACRILIKIVLMIVLSGIEVFQRKHFHHYRGLVLCSQCIHSLTDDGQIGSIGVVNACAVLRAMVSPLTVQTCGVDGFEIELEQELQSQYVCIIDHMHRFCSVSVSCADLLIRGMRKRTVGITRFSVLHSPNLLQEMFCSPKASPGKIDFSFLFHFSLIFDY